MAGHLSDLLIPSFPPTNPSSPPHIKLGSFPNAGVPHADLSAVVSALSYQLPNITWTSHIANLVANLAADKEGGLNYV